MTEENQEQAEVLVEPLEEDKFVGADKISRSPDISIVCLKEDVRGAVTWLKKQVEDLQELAKNRGGWERTVLFRQAFRYIGRGFSCC